MSPIAEAKKICPDIVIVSGEDLTRFRDVSKDLYNFLQEFIWSKKVERLGLDEVFMDVTDMIDFNVEVLNLNDRSNSFFHLSRTDPTVGFSYDLSLTPGYTYPSTSDLPSQRLSAPTPRESDKDGLLCIRLLVASHLARHLRQQLEADKGYTVSSGISTSKLLAKLAGEVHKPNAQTTILPPYEASAEFRESNVTAFLDAHEVGRIPWIGFKLAHQLRNLVLGRTTAFSMDHVYGGAKEKVLVRDVRCFPSVGPELLEKILRGPGTPQGIGSKTWELLNGIDNTEVLPARKTPKQISIEDSYLRLNTLEEVTTQLKKLAESLIRRMHIDLLEDDDDENCNRPSSPNPTTNDGPPVEAAKDGPRHPTAKKRWIACPRTIRLSTRSRSSNDPSTPARPSFNRSSRSCPAPPFLFSFAHPPIHLAAKLATETLIPLFRRLHPEKSGWDLSLVNVAVVNMVEGDGGRGVERMFKRLEERRKVTEEEYLSARSQIAAEQRFGSEDCIPSTQDSNEDLEDPRNSSRDGDGGTLFQNSEQCDICGAVMPDFAMPAHERFHAM
ncbi:hypothetical protein GP486_001353 [Trichoglossum hirsutum]|uniref:UmuC domain-containing protein n=1 Tax=Trichoglossum hirsutum TaxID=265104 RepID=A0A9P8LH08_9PEZI|nr:hypothetical protein GP486_001353 [Trichoglossum hirsutum]